MTCSKCGRREFMDTGLCFDHQHDEVEGAMRLVLIVVVIVLLVGVVVGTWAVIELVQWLTTGGAS